MEGGGGDVVLGFRGWKISDYEVGLFFSVWFMFVGFIVVLFFVNFGLRICYCC